MKELFDRHQERLTDTEDRRVWSAVHDEMKKGRRAWRGWRISVGAVATVAVAAIAMTMYGRLGSPPPAYLTERTSRAEQFRPEQFPLEQTRADQIRAEQMELPEANSRGDDQGFEGAGKDQDVSGAHAGDMREAVKRQVMSPRPADAEVQMTDHLKNGPASEDKGKKAGEGVVVSAEKRTPDQATPPTTLREPEALAYTPIRKEIDEQASAGAIQGRIASPNPEVRPSQLPPVDGKPLPPRGEPIAVGGTDPVNGAVYDAMFFEHYGVNPFVDPQDDRFATFAVDVDNASYSLARNYLNRGVLPPKDAVRVEEFVNAFDHNYAAPEHLSVASTRRRPVSRHGTFAIHLDGAPSPFGDGLVLMRVGLKGREIHALDRKPAMLTFVVDVSGSMERENRLELVKRALFLLLDEMNEEDEVALVVYGTNARTILRHTPLRERRMIESAIWSLRPEGATNAEAGLREAYHLAGRNHRDGYINRVILCSDGVANVGRTGAEGILGVIGNEAGRGIYLTTVGFGMGNYNDVLMEKLADQGEGNYYYVDDIDEAEKVFVENLTGTLQTIARQVKIQVEFEPGQVRRYRLLGYENRDVADRDFRNDRIDAGEVGAGHEVTALFEVKLEKDARKGDLATVRIRYEDPETGRVTEEMQTLRLQDIREDLRDTDPTFRMDAAVAEFAEILRHSYWAKDSDLRNVARLAREASRDAEDPEELRELCRLVDTADRLWDRSEPTWHKDVRPAWTPEDDDPRR